MDKIFILFTSIYVPACYLKFRLQEAVSQIWASDTIVTENFSTQEIIIAFSVKNSYILSSHTGHLENVSIPTSTQTQNEHY